MGTDNSNSPTFLIREFTEFINHLGPEETPFIESLSGPAKPYYYYPTQRVEAQPHHQHWMHLKSVLEDIQENHCPGDEWEEECDWKPSSEYYSLLDLMSDLHRLAFTTEPNPDYDFYRAERWDRMHPPRRTLNQKKVEWGVGYVIPVNEPGKFDEGTQEEQQEDE